jgi:hypothetical protein
MAFKQFNTFTRPDNSIPFFEQTFEGKYRVNEKMELADTMPDLVYREVPVRMEEDPDTLCFTSTFIFSDFGAWMTYADAITQLDPTYRDDRARYYQNAGHTSLMEYQDDTMEERELLCRITPTEIVTRNVEGVTITIYKDGLRVRQLPNGEITTFHTDGTITVVAPDGTVTNAQSEFANGFPRETLPEGISSAKLVTMR